MTVLTHSPLNTNFFQKNRFRVVFPRVPNVEYFAQGIDLPDVGVDPVNHATPLAKIFVTGVNIKWGPLIVNMMVDEDLRAWEEMFNWMIGETPWQDPDTTKKGRYVDMSLILMTNANNPNMRFTFIHTFPTYIGKISMTADTEGANMVMTVPIHFRYDSFKMERIRQT